jgi:DNA-binding FadR family transcriptional regulator
VGRGTYLRETTALSAYVTRDHDEADTVGPVGLMAVRRTIEPYVLPLVVTAATSKDFEEMERCLRGGDTAQTRDEFEAWDFALHHAIVAATHNALLVRMYQTVEAARHGQVWGNLKRRHDSTVFRRAYQEDHRAVVEALKAREPELAVKAMNAHLDRVAGILFKEDAPLEP